MRKFHEGGIVPKLAGPVLVTDVCPLARMMAPPTINVHVHFDGPDELVDRIRQAIGGR